MHKNCLGKRKIARQILATYKYLFIRCVRYKKNNNQTLSENSECPVIKYTVISLRFTLSISKI